MIDERLEGGHDSKAIQLFRKVGYNQDVQIKLGTVKSAPPNMRINVDGMKYDLDPDDYAIAEHLTAHTRQVKINGTTSTIEYSHALKAGDRVIIASANKGQRYYVLDKAVT
ncbi:DUF2577 domain-containing protein [Robertmurraya andreesenii]|uniref:DUF2577 domain-containing protein n=1 Tax=Anoxybacillus andreesenii TaxID=1325932 RepID=A0ABT9V215_9BACL|nr:DUF2577 domain-containing protein [Robertmurraya andreesenii]MDQ0154905.1 hypothetical protein [Robertmurraya andreesenii]